MLSVLHIFLNRRQALSILPSYLRRNGEERNAKTKKSEVIKTWDRDIVCLPSTFMGKNNHIPFPRGKSRAYLARNGLVGKLHISSDMNENDVLSEIRSVFNPL